MEPLPEELKLKPASAIGPVLRGGFAIRDKLRSVGAGRAGGFVPGTGGGGGPPASDKGWRGFLGVFFGVNGSL